MTAFWLFVAGASLIVGSFLYWVSKPPRRVVELWWVIPRRADYNVVRRYMRENFKVDPPAALLLDGFTWVGPFGMKDYEKFPPAALWLVPIVKGEGDANPTIQTTA